MRTLGLLLVAAATAVSGFALGASQQEQTARPNQSRPGLVQQGADDPTLSVALASAQQALNRQARLVLRGDVNASADVPFRTYHVRLSGGTSPSQHQLRVGRFSATTVITYRIAGEGVDVGRVGEATFRRVSGDWVLASSSDDHRDLWAHGPVDVETAGRSVVIGSTRYASELPSFTSNVNQARAAVADFWGGRWPGKATVVLPGSERVMNPLIGSPDASRLPAVTSWLPSAGGGFARTTINPKVYFTLSTLGRQIVLRHEITHLAEDFVDAAFGSALAVRRAGRIRRLSRQWGTCVAGRGCGPNSCRPWGAAASLPQRRPLQLRQLESGKVARLRVRLVALPDDR